MSLLERHLGFVAALREAGLPVSLAEARDAVDALARTGLAERDVVQEAYAATLVKRSAQRPTFDAVFDLWFPRLVGEGASAPRDPGGPEDHEALEDAEDGSHGTESGERPTADGPGGRVLDGPDALAELQERLVEALAAGDQARLRALAVETVRRFGALPGRGPGLASWSAHTTLRRVAPAELVDRVVAALTGEGQDRDGAGRAAQAAVTRFTGLVEQDALRRLAEAKGPEHVSRVAGRPTIDRVDFTGARRSDLERMRREIQPLARRLATRLTREAHARRRGPLDFRRTVRASVSTGGVPLTTHHRPRRPHRSELVVLTDVSGSVASFAQFTLMLVFALREQFGALRAFTFVDEVTEVTGLFRPGDDPGEVLARLAASTAHAAATGRTSYGRAFRRFAELQPNAVGPRTSLLVLGDARSNYGDLGTDVLSGLVDRARHAHWLNPEHRRHWDTGDSAAAAYGALVPMVECRNLAQLGEFVHDLAR